MIRTQAVTIRGWLAAATGSGLLSVMRVVGLVGSTEGIFIKEMRRPAQSRGSQRGCPRARKFLLWIGLTQERGAD